MWCIDFQSVAHLMDEVISSEMVAKYVEGNLEYYIEELTSNSMYKLHIALIKEAYEAYNLGFYKLCVFPLISTFDYVFSLWCEGKIQKINIKGHLSYLIAVQMLRTKQYRENMQALENKLAQLLADDILKKNFSDYEDGKVQVKATEINKRIMQVSMLFDKEKVEPIAKHLHKHCWFVCINNTEQPFYTSDNPVVRHAHKEDKLMSYGGIALEGIEIVLTLSSNLILVMGERSFHSELIAVENQFVTLPTIESVDFYNFVQVSQSNRQIFCLAEKFDLIEKMKEEQPELLEVRDNVEIRHNGKVYKLQIV